MGLVQLKLPVMVTSSSPSASVVQPPRPVKRRRRRLNNYEKHNIVQRLLKGEKPTDISTEFERHPTVIQSIWINRKKIEEQFNNYKRRRPLKKQKFSSPPPEVRFV